MARNGMLKSDKVLERIEKLRGMNNSEWESICRNCGACCLTKIDQCGKVLYSPYACPFLDLCSKKCKNYASRLETGSCYKVDLDVVLGGRVVPDSCAYVEYIYGAAKYPANINWKKVKSLKTLKFENQDKIYKDVILESVNWTRGNGDK